MIEILAKIREIILIRSERFNQFPDKFNVLLSQIPIEVKEVVYENNAHPLFLGMFIIALLQTYPPSDDLDGLVSAMYVTFVVFTNAEAMIHNTADTYIKEGVKITENSEVTDLNEIGIGVISVMIFVCVRTLTKLVIENYF